MTDLFLRPLFTWRSVVASKFGPANPTTRHVLLTLGLHMSDKGDSCFPSMALLSDETGLGLRTVKEHIALAAEDGWIGKRERRLKNTQGWKRNEYFAQIPADAETMFHAEQGGAAGAPRKHGAATAPSKAGAPTAPRQGGAANAERGAADSMNAVHQEHLSTSVSTSLTEGHAPTPSGSVSAAPGSDKGEGKTSACWRAYVEMMKGTYGVEPPRSARLSGQFANLVSRVGAEDAPKVIRHFFAVKNEFYGRVKHDVGVLLKDVNKLVIEMKQGEARANADRWWVDPDRITERAKKEGVKGQAGDSFAMITARLYVKIGHGPWADQADDTVRQYMRELTEAAHA